MGASRLTGTQLKLSGLAEWNKSHYKSYNLTEGVVPEGNIVAPKGLSATAKKAWNTTVPALMEMRSLSVTDFVQLENLFTIYDELLKARKAIKEFDKNHSLEEKGALNTRRSLNTWLNNTQQTFTSLASRFGMTPVDRTRLPIEEEEEDAKDPLEVLVDE
jgi:P27 family predicted phage terminase small subunit